MVEPMVDAVKKGADGYIIKPIKMDNLLNSIKENLKKQEEEKSYSEEKIAEFIKTRIRELNYPP